MDADTCNFCRIGTSVFQSWFDDERSLVTYLPQNRLLFLELTKLPKWRGQSEATKNCFDFIGCLATPIRQTAIMGEPLASELPASFHRYDATARHIPLRAPLSDMFFRPEEEHRTSGEENVRPPLFGRNREMDNPG